MRLLDSVLWVKLQPYLNVNGRRRNIDVRASIKGDESLLDQAINFWDECASCKTPFHPIRARGTGTSRITGTEREGHMFLSMTCDSPRCSRTNEAKAAKDLVLHVLMAPRVARASRERRYADLLGRVVEHLMNKGDVKVAERIQLRMKEIEEDFK